MVPGHHREKRGFGEDAVRRRASRGASGQLARGALDLRRLVRGLPPRHRRVAFHRAVLEPVAERHHAGVLAHGAKDGLADFVDARCRARGLLPAQRAASAAALLLLHHQDVLRHEHPAALPARGVRAAPPGGPPPRDAWAGGPAALRPAGLRDRAPVPRQRLEVHHERGRFGQGLGVPGPARARRGPEPIRLHRHDRRLEPCRGGRRRARRELG
mmetsp:Transcript_91783/g.264070  ORF Transcript_91783/g.264070 Transcript_91783/m.264070 type:complete len:214 (-) Transcript_91783:250-891(-)